MNFSRIVEAVTGFGKYASRTKAMNGESTPLSKGDVKMSDIVNPLTGRVFKQVDSTLAEILVDAGIMRYNRAATENRAANTPTRPEANTFAVGVNGYGQVCIVLATPTGQVTHWRGDPSNAKDAFKVRAWSGAKQAHVLQGPEPSSEIIAEYIAAVSHEVGKDGRLLQQLNEARVTTPGKAAPSL